MDQVSQPVAPKLTSKSLRELVVTGSDTESELRVRYEGWDHKTRFFTPHAINQESQTIEGQLDCGEKISFPLESSFWVPYEEGMENSAKPI